MNIIFQLFRSFLRKISASLTTESLDARAKRGSRKKFERAMNQVSRVAPQEFDRL
jgi:hypothetical protein